MTSLARNFHGIGLIILTATAASAQEAGGGGNSVSLVALIFLNWTMWPLLILSVVGVSMAIQRLITITPDVLVPDDLADDMHNIFAEGVNEEASEDAINAVSGDANMLGEIWLLASIKGLWL